MGEYFSLIWEMLKDRATVGPFFFRFIVAPTVSCLFALRAGLKDIKEGRKPYFYTILTEKANRKYLYREGWKDIGRIFIVMTIIDVTYQIIVFRCVFPGQVLIVAVALAIIPYLLMRGLVVRIGRSIIQRYKQNKD